MYVRSALTPSDWEIRATCGKCRVPQIIEKDDIRFGMVNPEGPHDMPEEHFYFVHCDRKNILSNVPDHLRAYAEKQKGRTADLDVDY